MHAIKLLAGTTGQKPHGATLASSADTMRLVIIPGLETPSGDPVLAWATGHPRRPVLTVLGSFASLAAHRAEGGAA